MTEDHSPIKEVFKDVSWTILKQTLRYSPLHPRFLAHRELRNLIIAECALFKGVLLDVGCGNKPYAELFSNVDWYIGLDVPTTIHRLFPPEVYGSALALPFTSDLFDCVLCSEVLEHIPDPTQTLSEMCRVLKPNGYLLLTVPFSEQLHEEPYDFYRFTPFGLEYLLRKCGYESIRYYERGGTWLELGYRLSSFLYTTIGATKDQVGYLRIHPILGPPVILICLVIQTISLILDKIWPSKLSSIGYGVLAVKTNHVL